MQQEGGLKKRRKRNLTKVTGLLQIQYEEEQFHPLHPSQSIPIWKESIKKRDSISSSWEEEILENEIPHHSIHNKKHFLLDTEMIWRLRQMLFMGVTSCVFPWRWDNGQHRVVEWTRKYKLIWWVCWTLIAIQTCLLSIFQIYSLVTRRNELEYRSIFASSLAIYWYLLAVYYTIMIYIYMDSIKDYINTLFRMHEEFCDKYLEDIANFEYPRGTFRFMNISTWINISQLGVSVTLFFVTPYQPWYLYSYIQDLNLPWISLIPGGIQQYIVVGNALTNCLLLLWLSLAHNKVSQFWLREIHKGNESGFTKESLRHSKNAIHTYKCLQVLTILFNNCGMANMGLPLVKATVFFGVIPCGYVLIRSFGPVFVQEFPGILTYPVGLVNGLSFGFNILNSSAVMNDLACSFLDSWCKTREEGFRKVLLSLCALKVKVAMFYGVTVSTTFKFGKITIDYLVDCIITFK